MTTKELKQVWREETGAAPESPVLEVFVKAVGDHDNRRNLLAGLLRYSQQIEFGGENERAVWLAQTLRGFGNDLPEHLDFAGESTAQHLPVQGSVSA